MNLRIKNQYVTSTARKTLASFLAATINGELNSRFEPYKPNEHDDSFWTVDYGNDWKVKFFDDEPYIFEIIYRYDRRLDGIHKRELALAGWLVERLGVDIVEGA
jgi:hypothetical protein